MLNPVALAFVSWIGLVVSVVGLIATFYEARRARLAALSAVNEVAKVVTMTRSRAQATALSHALGLAGEVSSSIANSGMRGSLHPFTAFRREVALALATFPQESAVDDAAAIDAALGEIARLMNSGVEEKARRGQMEDRMRIITGFLIKHEALAKTKDLA